MTSTNHHQVKTSSTCRSPYRPVAYMRCSSEWEFITSPLPYFLNATVRFRDFIMFTKRKLFLYTFTQNPRLRTVYRQQKWPLPAPVRKVMALGRKITALGCQVFHFIVNCSEHGLRGFIDAVQRHLATQIVIMLTSCWQMLSEFELRRIFDVFKRWANSSFVCICKEKYGSIHEATRAIRLLIVWKSSTYPQCRPGGLGRGFVLHSHTGSARTARFGLLYRNILFSYRQDHFQTVHIRFWT